MEPLEREEISPKAVIAVFILAVGCLTLLWLSTKDDLRQVREDKLMGPYEQLVENKRD